jgi:hypothetical protein
MNLSSENNGFKMPEGYFNRFPDRILSRIQEDRSAPRAGEDPAFKVPDGYFDSFPGRLERRLEPKQSQVRSLWGSRLGWIAAAAAAVVLMLVLWPEQRISVEYGDLNGEAIVEYLQAEEWDFSSEEIAELLSLEEIAMEDMLEKAPGDEQIMDYLESYSDPDDEFYLESDE